MRIRSTIRTANDMIYYYEQEGSGPHIVLIPDGLGDCQMFDRSIPTIAAAGFTVTTFDMPGLSRSSAAPSEIYTEVTPMKLAGLVINLLDALYIDIPTFWGSSSGGATVLALASQFPARVRNGLPHEVPTFAPPEWSVLLKLTDDELSRMFGGTVFTDICGNRPAWDGLGDEVHARLWKNYPWWAKGYLLFIPLASATFTRDDLVKRPLDWMIGAATPAAAFLDNVVTATKAGVEVGVIPGRHFPYVSDPEPFAKHVIEKTRKYNL